MLDQTLRRTLGSGLVALSCQHRGSEHVEVALSLPAGAACETAEQCGLANFAARATLLGTAEMDFERFNEALDAFGASLAARPGADSSVWRGACLSGDLPRLLRLLRAALEAPRMAADDVERLRAQLLTGIRERDQDTMRLARIVALELAYGRQHPYGRPATGLREVVEGLDVEELRGFAATHLWPAGGTIAVVGPLPADALLEGIEAGLGDWAGPAEAPEGRSAGAGPAGPAEAPAKGAGGAGLARPGARCSVAPVDPVGSRRDLCLPGKTQTDIAMAVQAMPRRHEDFEPLSLANLIFGRFGLGGRLGQKIRDEMGLAYYCSTALVGAEEAGPWVLAAGVNPASVELALTTVREELDRLRREPVTEPELRESVGFARGSLVVELEEPAGLVETILRLETQGLGLGYIRDYLAWLDHVRPPTLLAAAWRYLDPARISVVTVGPER
jgi:zinc protease